MATTIAKPLRSSPRPTVPAGGASVPRADAYPELTREIGNLPSLTSSPSGLLTSTPGGLGLGQTVMKAIGDVLGWQVKPDTKGFLGALNASFTQDEKEGRTEVIWKPRTYAVQTDVGGGVTGAQASLYKRAKESLDQSLPLLDGLQPLFKEAKEEDISALRATVRSQFTDLVNELGMFSGPRIARVTQLFFLLLGQKFPQKAVDIENYVKGGAGGPLQTDPEKVAGSLGNLRVELGFSIADDQINTVDDEQNVTNFRIISDYITSLAQSWLNNLRFFGLQSQTPFFGTQLVLLSRQLSVISESVNEVRFTLDSVFIGAAERQTLQINFTGEQPAMFLEDLLSWIDSFASEEGPRLIEQGGKFAVGQSFVPIANQLLELINARRKPVSGQQVQGMPPGYSTNRVQFAFDDLANSLKQLATLATPIQHVITPEPQPALAVLGINPNVVFRSQAPDDVTITIIGTGFDVNNQTGLQISGDTQLLSCSTKGILSDNLAFVTLHNLASKTNGAYILSITMTNRGHAQPATLITTLSVF
jgi:hypothetical protein